MQHITRLNKITISLEETEHFRAKKRIVSTIGFITYVHVNSENLHLTDIFTSHYRFFADAAILFLSAFLS